MRAFLKSPLRSRRACAIGAALIFASAAAHAQLQITSSPNFVGSGARALGMGGAFIAIADDATAASWNPGGLVQLERPEISLVYGHAWREESFSDVHSFPIDAEGSVSIDDLNYASVVYPLPVAPWGRNIVVSLNYQRRYDFNRKLHGSYLDEFASNTGSGNIFATRGKIDYQQSGSLNALTPAAAIELTKKLSIGIAADFYRSGLGENGWTSENEQHLRGYVNGMLAGETRLLIKDEYEDINGTSFTIGALWSPTERLSVGAVYHSALTLHYSQHTKSEYHFPGAGLRAYATGSGTQRWRAEFPAALALGAAYRVNDRLTVSFDVTRRLWSDFVTIRLGGQPLPSMGGAPYGQRLSAITNLPQSQSDIDDVYTVRAGAEYVFADPGKFLQQYLPTLRVGAFYDPEPASGKPDPVYGLAIGAGLLIHDRVNIDFAYQYRFGDGVRGDTFGQNFGQDRARGDVAQHELLLSTVIYF